MTITAVIITKNEEHRLRLCLDSLKDLVDEIIIVDDQSTDNTVLIAEKEYNAKVYIHSLNNKFDIQRNLGNEKASSDWILQLDADEIIPARTAEAIKKNINSSNIYECYRILRRDCFGNIPLKSVGNTYQLKLFRRGKAYYQGNVHEQLIVKGAIGVISDPILHFAYPSLTEIFSKHNFYTNLDAQKLITQQPELTQKALKNYLLFKTAKIFWKHYFRDCGFKDGNAGLMWSFVHTIYPVMVWLKALEILENKHD